MQVRILQPDSEVGYSCRMDSDREWIKVGADAVSIGLGQQRSITTSKIKSIGKRWIILENGERFHILGLDRQQGGAIGGQSFRLYPPGHERVQRAEVEIASKIIMEKAVKAAQAFVNYPTTDNAEKAVAALLPFTPYVIESNHE